MIKTGQQHLESLKDGRTIYIGDELVEDVTTHPAFARAAKTVARLYDIKHDPDYQDILTFKEDGERYSAWFLQAQGSPQRGIAVYTVLREIPENHEWSQDAAHLSEPVWGR